MIQYGNISATEALSPTEPVTLAEVKTWGRIDIADDDDLLSEMITGARQDIENETSLKLVENTVELYVDASAGDSIMLPYGLGTAVALSSIDAEGTEEAADTEDYYQQGEYLKVIEGGSLKVTYTVGTTAPQALKEAIMMLVVYRYKFRGDQDAQMGFPPDVERKIHKYIQVWL